MSWQLSNKLTTVYRAVTLALLYPTFCLSAQAVIIGETTIKSAQYEPLSASIAVSDIDAKNFSAQLADPNLYKQMGLTLNDNVQVHFVATGDNSGRIVLTSSQPVSAPFTDVVLTFNDNNGKQQLLPKTLLMPLARNVPSDTKQQMIASAIKPNLPVIGEDENLLQEGNETLTSTDGSPNLPSTTEAQNDDALQASANDNNDENLTANQTRDEISQASNNNELDLMNPNNAFNNLIGNEANKNLTAQTNNTKNKQDNKQLEVLTMELTRTITPAGEPANDQNSITTTIKKDLTSSAPLVATNNKPSSSDTSEEMTNKQTQSNVNNHQGQATYTVQRNDNLWTIANQLASKNNADVQTVMQQIQTQNPDAFIDGKANLLKANATLVLPNYEVIPSQLGIKAATDAKTEAQSNVQASASSSRSSQRGNRRQPHRSKNVSKAQMTLVTPGQKGKAYGTQTNARNGVNASVNPLVKTLKSSRKQTAAKAERVSGLNDQLSSYTQKLQLQNQKLAELEARLKSLRNQ